MKLKLKLNNEVQMAWKEVVVAYFRHYSDINDEENHENFSG
jgi:hypothetical protein